MQKLNLGCRTNIKEGYINLDIRKLEGVDVVWDLEKFPYPFKDNYFDEIYARQIIGYLTDFERTMKELFRILKPEGRIIIEVLHFSGASGYHPYGQPPFSCNFFQNLTSLNYYLSLWLLDKIKLKFYKGWYFYNHLVEPIVNLNNLTREIYENTFLHSLFPANSIYIELKKRLKKEHPKK